MAACGTTLAIWFASADLWAKPRHTLPATAAGMGVAVLGRLALEVILAAHPAADEILTEVFPEVITIIAPIVFATLGVLAWRFVEVWHEDELSLAVIFGFDTPAQDNKPTTLTRTGGGHFGFKVQLPPSRFGAKRKPRP